MFNSTQIVDAVVAAPGVAYDWVISLSRSDSITLSGVVATSLPVVGAIGTFFYRRMKSKETETTVALTVNIPEREDSDKLSREIFEKFCEKDKELCQTQQTLQSKDEEIKALKDVIDGLREPQKTQKQIDYAAQAEAELAKGNTDLAKAFFNEEAKKNVDGSDELRMKAAQAYRRIGALDFMNDPKEAVKAYQKSVELDPNSAEAWNRLGLLRYLFGELEEAEKAYQKVLELKSDDKEWKAAAYGNLGLIRNTQGDLEGAEEYHLKSLAIEKELGRKEGMAADYGNLGLIRNTQGDLEGAEGYWQKSLDLYKQIGAAPMIEKIQGWLDDLEANKGS